MDAQPRPPYRNPVIPGFYPDPSVCRFGPDYLLVNSSFGYFPGVPLFESPDLIHWNQIGHVLTREIHLPLEGGNVSSGGIYAPTIRAHRDRLYVITTNVTAGGNFIVTAPAPQGPWSDPVWIGESIAPGIDPSLFFDEDGSVYFTGAHLGIYQFQIDIQTGKPLGDLRRLWSGTGGQCPEGPHLFRRGEFYYLTIAEGGTEYGHMQTIARSRGPWGPWEPCPHNPILTHRSRSSEFQALGHSDFVQGPDGLWWLVFHVNRPCGYPRFHVCGRETCLAPVEWIDDWPVVNGGELIRADMGSPSESRTFKDDFNGSSLSLNWAHLRNPEPDNYRLGERSSYLGLVPSTAQLSGAERPTFVGTRQTSHETTASAMFDFSELEEGDEAGLTIFQNETHHYEIAATRQQGSLELIVRRRIGDLNAIVARVPAAPPRLVLGIEASPELYRFVYQVPGDGRVDLASGAARYLGTETAGMFTGCLFGLYAVAASERKRPGVWIDWYTGKSVT